MNMYILFLLRKQEFYEESCVKSNIAFYYPRSYIITVTYNLQKVSYITFYLKCNNIA